MIYLTDYRTAFTTSTEMMEDVTYPQRVHWFPETYNRVSTGLTYVPHKLADKVLDPELTKRIRENPKKTAFILAAGNTHFAGINPMARSSRLTYTYKMLPFTLNQVFAGRTAQSFGVVEHIVTDASACASSLKVMMDVQNLVNVYNFERVIVLAVEDAVSNMVLEFFGEAQASLSRQEEDAGFKPSAFDSHNYGFFVGQGAALAVFETSADQAQAQLKGAYTASEHSTNAIGQREDGEGFVKAINGAMSVAKVSPEQITMVKTHGTGTKSNNVAEKAALQSTLKEFVATSLKPTIGHTMGASGLLETLILLDNLRNGVFPGIGNRTEEDNVFLSGDTEAREGYILSLAAGMGNVYSAAIFESMVCK